MSEALEKFNNIMKDFVNKSYEELRDTAKQALAVSMNFFAQFDKDHNGASAVVAFMGTMFAADGNFSALEYQLLKDLVGEVDYETAKATVQSYYSDEWENAVDQLIDACDTEMKSTILVLVTCFAAVDETIKVEEQRFIAKLLA
ncbi:MAG: hypothetical protein J6U60_00720 [Clostridia bacterium]|nr:hypothetical protein [Clostridia bacterium]